MLDALRGWCELGREVFNGSKRGHMEGSGVFDFKSSGWESGRMMSYCNSWSGWPMRWHVGLTLTLANPERTKSDEVIRISKLSLLWWGSFVKKVLTFGFFFNKEKSICVHIHLVGWLKKREIQLKNANRFAGNTRLLLSYSSCIMTCWFSLTEAWYRIAHGKGDFSVVISWLWKTIPNHFFCPPSLCFCFFNDQF